MLNIGIFKCIKLVSNCKVLVVGGNGFVGNCIANRLIQYSNSFQVSALSRGGPRYSHPNNSKINWIRGNAMQPQIIKTKINEADVIIHCVATLIDTSVTRLRKPGQIGTYEQMNRDTFIKILSVLEQNKKIILISAVGHPPFLKRYITTKLQAENVLLKSNHNGYVIRPGFIFDYKLRKWSIPLKYIINYWNKIYPFFFRTGSKISFLQKFIQEFEQSQPTSLQQIADSVIMIIEKDVQKKILQNDDLKQLSKQFQDQLLHGKKRR